MKSYNFISAQEGRLDSVIAGMVDELSRSYAARLIEDGMVTVNGTAALKSKHRVLTGDRIHVELPPPKEAEAVPEDIPLDIIYEDSDVLVVNKPRGMVVHPAAGNQNGTLVNALLKHCEGNLSQINGTVRPGIVHRIDKDTTGLLLVAKSNKAHIGLAEQLKEHSLTRKYITLVHNNIKNDTGRICTMIGRHPVDRKKMSVNCKNGREAITNYEVIERFAGYTLVECRLETGRTHQIRVHMSYMGNPIVGDKLYGVKKEKFTLEGQLLHAKTVGFIHPVTEQYLEFSEDIPPDFKRVIKNLSGK